MRNRTRRWHPPETPALAGYDEVAKTEGYADLCADYGINPRRPLSEQRLGVEAAREFLWQLEEIRRAMSGWQPELVAAHVEGLVLRAEGERGGLVWLDRHGPVVIVQDPLGESWAVTVSKATPELVAGAMARARHAAASPS